MSDDDSEDIVQEAYARLVKYRETNEVDKEEGFLVRTAVNISIDRRRQMSRINHHPEPADDIVIEDDFPDPERVAIGRSRLEYLAKGFEQLDPKTRAIVKARRIEGLSMREIALREGVSVSSVEKRIAKAMVFLSSWMRNL